MEIVLLVAMIMGGVMAIMAIGVIFGDRCLRGSCGGPDVVGPDGESLSCATCPHRPESHDSSSMAQLATSDSPSDASAV